jgi:Beta/Gamma crystallin
MKRLLFLALFGLVLSAAWAAYPDEARDRDADRDHDRDEYRRQERDREHERRRREPRVILYQDANYRGDSIVLYAGDVVESFSGMTFDNGGSLNDKVSSIRVEGGAQIFVYDDAHFRGPAMRLTESESDLSERRLPGGTNARWNDRISSVKVQVRPRNEPSAAEIDAIINHCYGDLLSRQPDEEGFRLYRGMIVDQGWTERMVRDNIRASDEFRREGVDRIIKRVYLEVLGREADPGGLQNYRRNFLEKNWSDNDLREALKHSDEYRHKPAHH